MVSIEVEGARGAVNRHERKRLERERDQKRWITQMKKRGGFHPRKAKYWGDECQIPRCQQWIDGVCQYQKRDEGKCVMEEKK